MREIWIDKTKCTQCQKCARECGLDIITAANGGFPQIHDPGKCFACGHCVAVCPSGAMMHSDFPYAELDKAGRICFIMRLLLCSLRVRAKTRLAKTIRCLR
jgi:heterodisulfide reductase subunit A-like polyferredoxin